MSGKTRTDLEKEHGIPVPAEPPYWLVDTSLRLASGPWESLLVVGLYLRWGARNGIQWEVTNARPEWYPE